MSIEQVGAIVTAIGVAGIWIALLYAIALGLWLSVHGQHKLRRKQQLPRAKVVRQ